jgi:hypothetical protein
MVYYFWKGFCVSPIIHWIGGEAVVYQESCSQEHQDNLCLCTSGCEFLVLPLHQHAWFSEIKRFIQNVSAFSAGLNELYEELLRAPYCSTALGCSLCGPCVCVVTFRLSHGAFRAQWTGADLFLPLSYIFLNAKTGGRKTHFLHYEKKRNTKQLMSVTDSATVSHPAP